MGKNTKEIYDRTKYKNYIHRKQEKNIIINKVKEWDSLKWREEMQHKSTLNIYEKFKKTLGEENWVDNTEESKLLIRGRTNTITLNWRNIYQGKSEEYLCCGFETETLKYFLLECPQYNEIKRKLHFHTGHTEQR